MKRFEQSKVVQELCAITYDMWRNGWDEYNGGNVSYLLSEDEVGELQEGVPRVKVEVEAVPESLVGRCLLITASGSHFRTLKDHAKKRYRSCTDCNKWV